MTREPNSTYVPIPDMSEFPAYRDLFRVARGYKQRAMLHSLLQGKPVLSPQHAPSGRLRQLRWQERLAWQHFAVRLSEAGYAIHVTVALTNTDKTVFWTLRRLEVVTP